MRIFVFLFFICTMSSCIMLVDHVLKPSKKEFTNKYSGNYTGLDTLIMTDGYYQTLAPDISIHPVTGKETYWYNSLMFYPNDLICTTSDPAEEVFSDLYSYAKIWGTYKIQHDTIICQFIEKDSGAIKIRTETRFFIIKDIDKLEEIPSGRWKRATFTFHPFSNRSGYDNWLLKKKWFYETPPEKL